MSIFEYNGSALVRWSARTASQSPAIDDSAFSFRPSLLISRESTRFTISFSLVLAGLATDAQTLYQKLVFRHKLYQLREERDMKPQTFASLVSALLYEKRLANGIYIYVS
ncbi:proteasome beta subunit C1 [Actinidia rufa]|uniref:Proteasome beta subunit C1 n=1 Tax=Actinidia rufa TaxID=165716 RepID=A0A7J0GGB3_9ERIC|nr:proteasome beta subunit C1 [Actinidia rufa]